MKECQIRLFCIKHGIKLLPGWRHSCNAVRPHDTNETDRHWNYKQAIFRALYTRKQTVFTEFKFDFSRVHGNSPRMSFPTCDIFWLDELMVIELESRITQESKALKMQQFKNLNCFVFDIQKQTIKEILERIGLVPDGK